MKYPKIDEIPAIVIISLLFIVSCASEKPFTREELLVRKLYYKEEAEDKEYSFKPAGFSVRPVQEQFVKTYFKKHGSDGVEFFTETHLMERDPKFYVGKLSAYLFR